MQRRRKRIAGWLLLSLAVLLLATVAAVRIKGVVLLNAEGRATGYLLQSGEWVLNEYPNFPASIDGPYVFTVDGQRQQLRIEPDPDGAMKARTLPVTDARIEVRVDDAAGTCFEVPLRDHYPRAELDVPMPPRLLVASDFEGEFDAFTTLLRQQDVIDDGLHWRFGDGHLVLVGDMVDRGHNVLPLLWLVYRLEAEAEAAGGRLHYVLGNHEQRLLTGQTRSVAKKYYGSFRLAGRAQRELFDESSELGRWLRSKPVLQKVGDYLFMHGGLSPEVLALSPSLAEIDGHAARYLTTPPDSVDDTRARQILWEADGVLWYRGLAMARDDTPKADAGHVRQALQHFAARHIVIGHTLAEHVGSDYDGAVIRVDVHHASGRNEALLVEGDAAYRVDGQGLRTALSPAVNLD